MGRDLAQDLREHCDWSDPLHTAIPVHNHPNTCDKQTLFWMNLMLFLAAACMSMPHSRLRIYLAARNRWSRGR